MENTNVMKFIVFELDFFLEKLANEKEFKENVSLPSEFIIKNIDLQNPETKVILNKICERISVMFVNEPYWVPVTIKGKEKIIDLIDNIVWFEILNGIAGEGSSMGKYSEHLNVIKNYPSKNDLSFSFNLVVDK